MDNVLLLSSRFNLIRHPEIAWGLYNYFGMARCVRACTRACCKRSSLINNRYLFACKIGGRALSSSGQMNRRILIYSAELF